MRARLGPLWLGATGDTDMAATQPAYADQLTAVMREPGLLAMATTTDESIIEPSTVARRAERLAARADHQAPIPMRPMTPLPHVPDLMPPAHPDASATAGFRR
jgi:hypothetical protein